MVDSFRHSGFLRVFPDAELSINMVVRGHYFNGTLYQSSYLLISFIVDLISIRTYESSFSF